MRKPLVSQQLFVRGVAIFVLASCLACWAQRSDAAATPQQISAALAKPTTFEFIETPLGDVVDYLKQLHKIEIQIDGRSLSAAGIPPTVTLTANIHNISLASGLLVTLRQVGLVCVVQRGFLLITTPDGVQRWGDGVPGLTVPKPFLKTKAGPAAAKVTAALAAPTILEFIETPLEDVVDFLSDQHKIPILIDRSALDDVGMKSDTPITRNMKGVTLRSALRFLLDQIGLVCVRQEEFLLITAPGEAKLWGGPLTPNPKEFEAATEKIERALWRATLLEFIDTPLIDVVDFLQDFHDIPIKIDERALEAEGLSMDAPITRNLKDVPLDAALTLTLDELKLAHKIDYGVLLITTQKQAGADRGSSTTPPATPPASTDSAYRIWSDSTGRFKIEAVLIRIANDAVILKKKDGSIVTVPLSRLSAADQQWVGHRQ